MACAALGITACDLPGIDNPSYATEGATGGVDGSVVGAVVPCVPDEENPCNCADGGDGVQHCNEEGDGWGPCYCPGTATGGDAIVEGTTCNPGLGGCGDAGVGSGAVVTGGDATMGQDAEGVAEDLCADVDCPGGGGYCDGGTAYGTYPSECNPETGQCDDAPAPHPRDCADYGLVCQEGQCVVL